MKKNYFSSLLKLIGVGAVFGLTGYAISKSKFSKETKDYYADALDSVKNVGDDIKRTYTAIGNEKDFKAKSNNLKESAKDLAKNAGKLILSASSDVYNNVSDSVKKVLDDASKDESLLSNVSKLTSKKTTKKDSKVVAKTNKKPTKKTILTKKK